MTDTGENRESELAIVGFYRQIPTSSSVRFNFSAGEWGVLCWSAFFGYLEQHSMKTFTATRLLQALVVV